MTPAIIVNALVAVLVGFGGTLAVVVAAAQTMGATATETASWVMGLCLAIGLGSAWLSLRHRMPIVCAWSTPGAALIAASASFGMPAAVGAFMMAAALILATAAIGPLARLIERLPAAVAAAMLAGVLFRFVVATATAAAVQPIQVLPLVAVFLIVRVAHASAAVLAVLVAAVAMAVLSDAPLPSVAALAPALTPALPRVVAPSFEWGALIGLGLPLYLVTMASQNLPGFAVLRAAGYAPPARSILTVTGALSLATAPLGAHTSNLAAITAAICTGPDTDPDPARRWRVGVVYGGLYLVLAAFGAGLSGFFAALPPTLIATVAGVALLAPLTGALTTAMNGVQAGANPDTRSAAVLTFAVTASGVAPLGLGSAFWGLAVGLFVLALGSLYAALRR